MPGHYAPVEQEQAQSTAGLDALDDASLETRRRFLGKFTSAVFAGLVAPAALVAAEGVAEAAGATVDGVPEGPSAVAPGAARAAPITAESSVIDRMLADLQRTLEKRAQGQPVRFGMAVDLKKCTGCHACTVACKAENMTPPEVSYNVVLEEEMGTYPNVRRVFMYKPCFHCDNPPCTPVCPVAATWKREEDGIVVIDYDRCIGCRYCLTACPYGSRFIDLGKTFTDPPQPYETGAAPEYGEARVRADGGSPVGNARKCHFCLHRIYEGMLPACAETCIGRAIHFGDLDDQAGLVAQLIASRSQMRLKEELGTAPSVYYLL